MGLRIFRLQIHHDALEGFPHARIQGRLVNGAVLLKQVCKRNGFARPDAESPPPIQIMFVVQADGHQLNGLQLGVTPRGARQHFCQAPFQCTKGWKRVVVSFRENAHGCPGVHAVHACVENDVVAFPNLVHAVALTVHGHLVVPKENVPRHGIPKHICTRQPVDLLRHKATERHRVHHAILVVANENGGGSRCRQGVKVIQSADAVVTCDASPNQNARQAVIQVGNLDGRMENGT